MSCSGAPTSVRSLEQRIRNLEGDDGLALRRRVGMALVVVGQMLPEGAIKGGSANHDGAARPGWRQSFAPGRVADCANQERSCLSSSSSSS